MIDLKKIKRQRILSQLNSKIDEQRSLKITAIKEQRYEMAATYRDSERNALVKLGDFNKNDVSD